MDKDLGLSVSGSPNVNRETGVGLRNINLGKSQITPLIRVSSAALFREDWFGNWWLVETWIFSDDPRQKNRQIVHGEPLASFSERPDPYICEKAQKAHAHIADNLRKRFRLSHGEVCNTAAT